MAGGIVFLPQITKGRAPRCLLPRALPNTIVYCTAWRARTVFASLLPSRPCASRPSLLLLLALPLQLAKTKPPSGSTRHCDVHGGKVRATRVLDTHLVELGQPFRHRLPGPRPLGSRRPRRVENGLPRPGVLSPPLQLRTQAGWLSMVRVGMATEAAAPPPGSRSAPDPTWTALPASPPWPAPWQCSWPLPPLRPRLRWPGPSQPPSSSAAFLAPSRPLQHAPAPPPASARPPAAKFSLQTRSGVDERAANRNAGVAMYEWPCTSGFDTHLL